MRDFGELKSEEVDDLVFTLEGAVIKALIKLGVGGLSALEVYGAIGAAVRDEYRKVRRAKSRSAKQSQ